MKPANESLRIFVGVELPESVKASLADAQRTLKLILRPGGTSWTRPESLHLTLRFLGDVPEARIEELKAALAGAVGRHRALELTCEGLGCFPNLRFPRILWAGGHRARGATASGSSGRTDDSSVPNPAGSNAREPTGLPELQAEALDRLQAAVSSACDPFAGKPDVQPFAGHVTLGRFRRLSRHDTEQVARMIERFADRQFGKWTAGEVVLFRSELRPDGARHSPIERFPLRRDCLSR